MNWFRFKACVKCGGDLALDQGDWLCLQCGTYYYTGLYHGGLYHWGLDRGPQQADKAKPEPPGLKSLAAVPSGPSAGLNGTCFSARHTDRVFNETQSVDLRAKT